MTNYNTSRYVMQMITIYFQIMYKDHHLFRATKTSVGYPLPCQNFDHILSQCCTTQLHFC